MRANAQTFNTQQAILDLRFMHSCTTPDYLGFNMNKFTEQNKAIDKDAQNTKTNKTNPPVTASNSQTGKTIIGDKAKQEVGTSKDTQNQQKDAFNGKWQDQIKAAKGNWSKISEAELVKSNGNEANLNELVQRHYSLNKDDSSKQVKSFIDKCKC